MNYERFGESRGMRILRALSANFRVGQFFGVEVRMYWIALILVPLLIWPSWVRAGYPAGQGLLMSVLFSLGLFVTIYCHEMGHIAAGWRYNIPTPLITISPMGGLAHMELPAPSPKASIFISAAGPATHLIWLAILWPLSQWIPWGMFRPEGWVADPLGGTILALRDLNLALLLFNLLPFFPMDGGRILRSILAHRMHPNKASIVAARVGMVGAVGMAIYGLFFESGYWGGILLMIAITNFFACKRELVRARWGESPYGDKREAWEQDSEAWKHGGVSAGARPSARARGQPTRSDRKAEQRLLREQAQEQADAGALDRLLERVSEVGLPGLSKKERAALQRLSKRSK